MGSERNHGRESEDQECGVIKEGGLRHDYCQYAVNRAPDCSIARNYPYLAVQPFLGILSKRIFYAVAFNFSSVGADRPVVRYRKEMPWGVTEIAHLRLLFLT